MKELIINKDKLKKEISSWIKNFEEKNQRKIMNPDKAPIKHLYMQYNKID